MRAKIAHIIERAIGRDIDVSVGAPNPDAFGHYSTNIALRLAKEERKNAMEVAEALAPRIRAEAPDFFDRIEVAPPGFLNFWVAASPHHAFFESVFERGEAYGKSAMGDGKKIIVEYSAPNIAKPMHVGHLRSTVIGDALTRILGYAGFKVIRWNYLGDWGTQFGKLIAAYKKWGDKSEVRASPIQTLTALYVRFHEAMKEDESLEKEGKEEFRKLEEGDGENRKLWQWFKDESLKEFKKTYDKLRVDFDVWTGESTYENELKPLVAELLKKNIAERSEGAVIVNLEQENLPPALVEKSDGASVYLTRDIAGLRSRIKEHGPAQILYVVGNEQTLHFSQLFAIAKRMELGNAELRHVKYGLMLGENKKKLSTREGSAMPLDELLEKIVSHARDVVREKNSDLPEDEREKVALAVGVGALKYHDLKETRTSDVVFDWKRMLDLRGASGPYIQYTYARLKSILRKAGETPKARDGMFSPLTTEADLALTRALFEFPAEVEKSAKTLYTANLAEYLYTLSVKANVWYEATPIIKDEDEARRDARLLLARATAGVLSRGLGLLGIETPERI